MRLALTHAYSWPEVRRGAERFIAELSVALAERGHKVWVFTAGSSHGRTRVSGVTTVKLRQLRRSGVAHEADFGRRVVPFLVAGRFDVVHSLGRRDAVASLRAARIRRHQRTVFTDLGNPYREYWEHQLGETAAHNRVVAEIDVYGCMSRFALGVLEADYGREGVLTPGGVDLDQLVPAPARAPEPTVLFSGAIGEPRKGVALLLEAVALVARDEPKVRLWLSGPGDPRRWLAQAPPAARDRTEYLGLGEATGQAQRYGRAWVTALPSKHDSFGMALVESLACGTPIVTSAHSAPQELVSAETGVVCEPDDPASLADALREAFELARDPGTIDACRAGAAPFDWRTGLAPQFERYYAGDVGSIGETSPAGGTGTGQR